MPYKHTFFNELWKRLVEPVLREECSVDRLDPETDSRSSLAAEHGDSRTISDVVINAEDLQSLHNCTLPAIQNAAPTARWTSFADQSSVGAQLLVPVTSPVALSEPHCGDHEFLQPGGTTQCLSCKLHQHEGSHHRLWRVLSLTF